MRGPGKGSTGALLEAWGSDVPDEIWDAVEKVIEAIDRVDQRVERKKPISNKPGFDQVRRLQKGNWFE